MGSGTMLEDARAAMQLADEYPAKAIPVATKVALRARRDQDKAAASIAERAWGYALMQCGEMDSAIRHLRLAVTRGEEAGSPQLAGRARMVLAFALNQRGRPAAALREIDAAVLALDGMAQAKARAQRGVILYQVGRLDEAMADYQSAMPTMRRSGDKLALARGLESRGLLHAERHEFGLAVADFDEARRLHCELGGGLGLGKLDENRAFVEMLRGDVPAALAWLDSADRHITEHGGLRGPFLQDRTEVLLAVGLVAEARETANQAVRAYQKERRQLRLPEARLTLAQAAFLDGDWRGALHHARLAAREFTRQQRMEWAALAQLTTLRTLLALGDGARVDPQQVESMVHTLTRNGWPAAALEARLVAARLALRRGRNSPERLGRGVHEQGHAHLQQASKAARRRGPAALRARGWFAEAVRRLEAGNTRGAASAARAGLRILDEHSAALDATDLRAHAAAHRTELVELGLRIAMEQGRPASVFEWAERGRARQLLHRPARPPDDPELARLLAEVRSVAVQLDRQRDDDHGSVRLLQRQAALERQIRDHRRLRRGGGTTGPLPAPVSVRNLGRALGNWALVEFVQFEGTLHALTVVDGRLRMHCLGAVAEVAALVERLPFALHRLARKEPRPEASAAADTLLHTTAERLDGLLLRPLDELGDRPLVVVPTGPLHCLPWSVLPSCAGRPVTVSPSATLWHATCARRRDHAGPVLAAAGPKLRGAREEAASVAAIHATTPLLDQDATVDAVLAALADASVAHLAAHGRLSADNPLFSDLQLADGPLVVYDIERLGRVPHTVVLAACESGRTLVCPGDELLGLSATFIARGAAQLIASVIPVPDAETAPLMVAFHRQLAAGAPPAVALAAAQQQLAGKAPAQRAAAAGFVCVGAGFSNPLLPAG